MHVCAIARAASVEQIAAIVDRASSADVACHPLSMFAGEGPRRAGLVLGYGAIATADIGEGLRRPRACF